MRRTAYLLLLTTALFWAGNAIAGKLAVGHVSPMLLTALRWALALAVLAAIGLPQLRADWKVLRPKLALTMALGGLGLGAFNVAFYTALNYTSAINVSIEQAGMPMFVILANFLLFSTRVTPAQATGFVMTLVGVVVVATHGDPRRLAGLDLNFGDAVMLLAIAFYGGYTVALRFKPEIHWKSLMIVMAFAALVTSLPFVILEYLAGATIWPDAGGWAITAYTALFPSLFAQVFFMRGVEMIGGNRASLFVNLVPIFGTLLSVLILGEAFRAYHAIAMVLVLGGIWLAERGGSKAS